MKRVLINPKETQPMYDAFHFSQANRVGDTIWVSGQVGIDSNLSPASGMAAQARLAFEGLKRTLAETGASLEDVVELTTFHIDLRGEMDEFAKRQGRVLPARLPCMDRGGCDPACSSGVADRNPGRSDSGLRKEVTIECSGGDQVICRAVQPHENERPAPAAIQ